MSYSRYWTGTTSLQWTLVLSFAFEDSLRESRLQAIPSPIPGIPNRPFPSSPSPLFQNESKCETFHMKMSSACSFYFHANQSHFHKNGFALGLAMKQRHKGNSEVACSGPRYNQNDPKSHLLIFV